MNMPIDDDDGLFDYLGVSEPIEITLENFGMTGLDGARYVARSGYRRALIGRLLAVRLRRDGACWRGDIARDPCAVA
jgi:hypothetical protein